MSEENETVIKIIVFSIILCMLIFLGGMFVGYYWNSFKNLPGN